MLKANRPVKVKAQLDSSYYMWYHVVYQYIITKICGFSASVSLGTADLIQRMQIINGFI